MTLKNIFRNFIALLIPLSLLLASPSFALVAAPQENAVSAANALQGKTFHDFFQDKNFQYDLYREAKSTVERQKAFGESLLQHLGVRDYEVVAQLKRSHFEDFTAAVSEKVLRKGYQNIAQMDDMVRGRINVDNFATVEKVVSLFFQQQEFQIKEMISPRRPSTTVDGGFGYPRYHIVVLDPYNGLSFEWQIGTQAITYLYEAQLIDSGLNLQGILNNFHDIHYVIFLRIVSDFPEVAQKYAAHLAPLMTEFDELCALAGLHGFSGENFRERVGVAANAAASLLQEMHAVEGREFLESFAHGSFPQKFVTAAKLPTLPSVKAERKLLAAL